MSRHGDKFDFAIEFLFKHEGGTNTDPLDRGGITKYGISQKQYPNMNILQLTKGQAAEIYHHDYWLSNKCDEFPQELATVLFDTGVNCGQVSAASWLQEVLVSKGCAMKVDGIIGGVTIGHSRRYDSYNLAMGVVAHRLERYVRLTGKHPKQLKFIRGWINRAIDLIRYVS